MKNTFQIGLLLIQMLRPKQWIKNLFIFFPLIFSGLFLDLSLLFEVSIVALFFSLFSWSTYILNDIHDRVSDAHHPKKKYRPIASGKVSVYTALSVFLFVFFGTLVLVFFSFPKDIFLLFLAYFSYTLFYSFFLKEQFLLDVFALSIGFLLRIFIGAALISVEPSLWILSMTFFVSLWFGFSKRYQELAFGKSTRKVLEYYSEELLRILLSMTTTILIVIYVFYAYTEHSGDALILSVPLFVLILIRYLAIILSAKDREKSIEDILLSDTTILVSGFLMLLCLFIAFSPTYFTAFFM